jgi:putative membrane protein
MKRVFGYGIAVLALTAAPALAQTSGAGGTNGTTQGRSGSTAGTQSGSQSGSTTGSQSGTRSGSQSGNETSARSSSQQGADHQFVMEAARGGMAEVELGKLASEKAQSEQVKQFGQRMEKDHGQANDELKSLAQQKNITLPTELDAKHKATQERLSKLSGAQFDRAYMQEMLQDHRKDVNEFRKESQSGKDPDVKAWAAKTLPTLEEHLRLAQSTSSAAVGTSGSKSGATSGATGRTGDTSGQGSSGRTGSGSSGGSGTSSGSGGRTGGSSGTPGTGSSSGGTSTPR